MKSKLRKLIFIVVLFSFSVISFFQSFENVAGKSNEISLYTIAQTSNGGSEDEPDPIIKPFGFWEWLESVLDGNGF